MSSLELAGLELPYSFHAGAGADEVHIGYKTKIPVGFFKLRTMRAGQPEILAGQTVIPVFVQKSEAEAAGVVIQPPPPIVDEYDQ